MKKILAFLLAFLLILFLGFALYLWLSDCGVSPFRCGEYPTQQNLTTSRINVGNGPEDMAVDYSLGTPRIIASCDDRRSDHSQTGVFFSIDITTQQSKALHIEPADFEIYPHGIDVVTIDSIPYLYAISHQQKGDTWRHPVFRFKIKGDTLWHDRTFEHPLLNVPNDLDVLSDGSFYATNYIPSMNPNESYKATLGMKTGSIVHFNGKNQWQLAVQDLCMPNGIWIDESKHLLYVANGACHEVNRYKLEDKKVKVSSKQSTLAHGEKITIGDNLLPDNHGRLWVTAHPCPLDFVAHSENNQELSPSQVFAIDPNTLKTNAIFQTNGELISAASTALFINDRLYVSQVFEPFVLVVEGLKL